MNKYEMNRKTIIYYIKEIKINILVNTIVYLNKIMEVIEYEPK